MITTGQIRIRLFEEVFNQPIMDNTMRGFWCEYMIAEALGHRCEIVGSGWHAWDLQIGPAEETFPNRIRIQVKNSARLQIWNAKSGKLSKCKFDLPYRMQPKYFRQDNPNTPCEEQGFMCDLFILCLHKEEDFTNADQTDPAQWDFYLLPTTGKYSGVTAKEITFAADQLKKNRRPSICTRYPHTMEQGIRGRPPLKPIGIEGLNVDAIYKVFGQTLPDVHKC